MATPVSNSVSLTGNPLIDGLTQGSSWQFGSGPRVITYSLNTNDTLEPNGGPLGGYWSQYPALADAVAAAFTAWSNVADITFQFIGIGGVYNSSTADIAVVLTGNELSEEGALAVGIFPDPDFADAIRSGSAAEGIPYPHPEGDIALDNYDTGFWMPTVGSFAFTVLLHEIGHAIGLKHTQDDGANARPTFAALGLSQFDNQGYTLMSELPRFIAEARPVSPMLLDIAAIQAIYGPNPIAHAEDDVYRLKNGQSLAIWDTGGNDTVSLAEIPNTGVKTITLQAGTIQVFGHAQFAIGYGVSIENLVGTVGSDVLIGTEGPNILDGHGGNDSLIGWGGDDTYIVDAENDQITEYVDGGIDSVRAMTPYTLPDHVENLQLLVGATGQGNALANLIMGSAFDDILRGHGGDDRIEGRAGADRLSGGSGADVLIGGDGDDIYEDYEPADTLIEGANGGTDTIITAMSIALPAHFENATVSGNLAAHLTGNDTANRLIGNAQSNDLYGLDGNDFLDGGLGSDLLVGGQGDDTLVIDSINDRLVELADEGNDTVETYADQYVLGEHIENLVLRGETVTASGNASANVIVGNHLPNILRGHDGDDDLDGGAGKGNQLFGDEGNDILRGRGDDILAGGSGDDTYYTSLTSTGRSFALTLTGAAGHPLVDGETIRYDAGKASIAVDLYDETFYGLNGQPDNLTILVSEPGRDAWSIAFHTWPASLLIQEALYPQTTATWTISQPDPVLRIGTIPVRLHAGASDGSLNISDADFELADGQWTVRRLVMEFEIVFHVNPAPLSGRLEISDQPFVRLHDTIIEAAGGGNDTLVMNVTMDMPDTVDLNALHVENATLYGDGKIDVSGSAGMNHIHGTSADNRFTGGAGDDYLDGGDGIDTAQLTGTSREYALIAYEGAMHVVDRMPARDGVDTLVRMEQIQFNGEGRLQSLASADVFTPLEYIASYDDLMDGFSANPSLGYEHFLSTGRYEGRYASFHALQYVASYTDLTEGFGTNVEMSAEHFIRAGRFEGRAVSFSGLEYIASYADLMNSLGADSSAGSAHYINIGRFEGRSVTFSGLDYIASYTDLMNGYGADAEAGAAHYIETGRFESRHTAFSGLEYLASHPDLMTGFGGNAALATEHYIGSGRHEGRYATFDALEYIAAYADLLQGFGASVALGASHYIAQGRFEGRTERFDAAQYLSNYADLQAGFGTNHDLASAHYINTGYYEGRTDQPI